jgi:hypothetical protein
MKRTEEMTMKELVDYWTGYACLGIGRGDFRGAISLMLQDTLKIGYDRGAVDALKAAQPK